jgi:hypothetical protein
MVANGQEKIKIAREYFTKADQGRPDVLELFHEDAKIYFPKFGLGFGRNSFLEMVKGFEGVLQARTRQGFDGVRIVSGESDDHPSGDFSGPG